MMIDFTNCNIELVSVHTIGNKANDEALYLSKRIIEINDIRLRELLIRFFTRPFVNPVFHNFTFSNEDYNLNPIYNYSSKMFSDFNSFHLNSINIAKHLYENTNHPQIKSGDLFVVSFKDILYENEMTDAIGLFKSENKQAFLKLNNSAEDFILKYDDGINVEKLDKGCIILNSNEGDGYKVCVIDNSNKSIEAQYWKEGFLNLKPCKDDFHLTKDFLTYTREFVTNQLNDEIEIEKADKIDILNRSVNYFKTHDYYDQSEFEDEILESDEIISAFRNYGNTFSETTGIVLSDSFEISMLAVRKQAKAFKRVLKLDKNFHIYIHGNKDLIERGRENDGRKYYKIYYENEE